MVQYNRSFYIFRISEQWFQINATWKDLFSFRAFMFIDAIVKTNPFLLREKTFTYIIHLEQKSEDIKRKFNQNVQREINKAITQNVECSHELNLNKFYTFFSEFAKLKKIYQPKFDSMFVLKDNLHTSFAKLNGEIIVAHSYIKDIETGVVRLFQSASKRLDHHYDKNIIGQANKLLTFSDIEYFKVQGYKIYDFGGVALHTQNKSLLGINHFKKSFGGQLIYNYNYFSPLLYVLRKLSQWIDKRY